MRVGFKLALLSTLASVLHSFPRQFVTRRMSALVTEGLKAVKGGVHDAFHNISNEINFVHIEVDKPRVECYCLSDMHADSARNQIWAKEHCHRPESAQGSRDDVFTVLIVPGDIGTEIESLGKVFDTLTANYDAVVYCVGNHECWRRGTAAGGSPTHPEARTPGTDRQARDSIEKIVEVLRCARTRGVFVGPVRLTNARKGSGVTIMPLQSWYHAGWDKEPDLSDPSFVAVEDAVPFARRWGDFAQCSWPGVVSHEEFASIHSDSLKLPHAFASLNTPFLDDKAFMAHIKDDTVLSFSHFVPRMELCPEKRFLLEPHLAKVIGSDALETQIRQLNPQLHMFGHTHIPIDVELDSIRYLQWPLGYQRESDKQCHPVYRGGPLLVYDSELRDHGKAGGEEAVTGGQGIPDDMASKHVHWTKYYLENVRDPTNQTLAPWVHNRLKSFEGLVKSKQKDDIRMRKS